MIKTTIEDIIFWIFILIIIGTALWLLKGSPPEIDAIITIGIAVAGSELLIWKKIFSVEKDFNREISKIDKSITISFMKMKNDLDKMNSVINNKLNIINNKLKK